MQFTFRIFVWVDLTDQKYRFVLWSFKLEKKKNIITSISRYYLKKKNIGLNFALETKIKYTITDLVVEVGGLGGSVYAWGENGDCLKFQKIKLVHVVVMKLQQQ